jgi:hypothetical protein
MWSGPLPGLNAACRALVLNGARGTPERFACPGPCDLCSAQLWSWLAIYNRSQQCSIVSLILCLINLKRKTKSSFRILKQSLIIKTREPLYCKQREEMGVYTAVTCGRERKKASEREKGGKGGLERERERGKKRKRNTKRRNRQANTNLERCFDF